MPGASQKLSINLLGREQKEGNCRGPDRSLLVAHDLMGQKLCRPGMGCDGLQGAILIVQERRGVSLLAKEFAGKCRASI